MLFEHSFSEIQQILQRDCMSPDIESKTLKVQKTNSTLIPWYSVESFSIQINMYYTVALSYAINPVRDKPFKVDKLFVLGELFVLGQRV
ncbi:8819_t:CDS:2, partial [Ambispora leptoticha]